jgi:hypothetical protein
MRFVDLEGMAPGDPGKHYRSPEAAALAWGKEFNGKSIQSRSEYGSVIYKGVSHGETYYSYNAPVVGAIHKRLTEEELDKNWNDVPKGTERVALIHSHGEYDRTFVDEEFSSFDKDYAGGRNLDSYLATPGGDLKVLRDDDHLTYQIGDHVFAASPESPVWQEHKKTKIYYDRFNAPEDNPMAPINTDINPIPDPPPVKPPHNRNCMGCYDVLPLWLQPHHTPLINPNQ